ncbi:MAG: hypothetical protein MJ224_00100 [archaeon]|nr:hypothetical protein [archaeon]
MTFGGVAVANYSILLPNMTDVRGEGGGFNFNGSSTSINEEDIQATDISVRITSSGVSGTMGLSDIGGSEPTESIKIVSEYPATGEEGKLYIKKAPVKASAELIDRGEVGTTRYYKIVDSYRGAPVNYSYDLDSAMHIVSVPAAGIEIKIPFGVMNP